MSIKRKPSLSVKDQNPLTLMNELPIFKHLPADVRVELASKAKMHRFGPDDAIIKFGEKSSDIHFLVTGTAVVISEFGDVCDTVVGPGHWFGEVGIMEKVPRTATVKSKTLCTTISLRDEDLASLVAKDAAFGSEIMSASNKRMQAYLERNVLA